MAGPHPYINRIFSMIFNMNKMIGRASPLAFPT